MDEIIDAYLFTYSSHVSKENSLSLWTPSLHNGVLSNRPCLLVSVSVGQSLNISETDHYFFLKSCMKYVINEIRKNDMT